MIDNFRGYPVIYTSEVPELPNVIDLVPFPNTFNYLWAPGKPTKIQYWKVYDDGKKVFCWERECKFLPMMSKNGCEGVGCENLLPLTCADH